MSTMPHTYTHVRFEPEGKGYALYAIGGQYDGNKVGHIDSDNTFATLECDKKDVWYISFEELSDIHHFMQELQGQGK